MIYAFSISHPTPGQVKYQECSNSVGNNFAKTGDDARTLLPQLAALANSGLKMLIWVRSTALRIYANRLTPDAGRRRRYKVYDPDDCRRRYADISYI